VAGSLYSWGQKQVALARFLLLTSLLSTALAHGPQVAASELQILSTPEGNFLRMQIDPPEANDQLRLIAVATPAGSALLEQQDGNGYRVVESIPLSHQSGPLEADSPHRVRLPAPLPRGDSVPVSILFSGGTLLQEEAVVTRAQEAGRRVLMRSLVAIILATTTFAMVWSVQRRRQETIG
jgi:hypothetical protein